jgi:hypothetical protein
MMVPANPTDCRLCRISAPIFPRSRLAPTTATVHGSKNGFIDAVAASWDRLAAFSLCSDVGPGCLARWVDGGEDLAGVPWIEFLRRTTDLGAPVSLWFVQ